MRTSSPLHNQNRRPQIGGASLKFRPRNTGNYNTSALASLATNSPDRSAVQTPISQSPLKLRKTFMETPRQLTEFGYTTSPTTPTRQIVNSPLNDPGVIAVERENNRCVGFGPGMASALIGNAGRRGNSMVVGDQNPRTALGTIGWGLNKANLE